MSTKTVVARQCEREWEMAEQERECERLAQLRTVQPSAHMHSVRGLSCVQKQPPPALLCLQLPVLPLCVNSPI